jgi:gluconate 2-dehydrogenase alpha chain
LFNNVKLLLNSKLGKPYDPKAGTGVVGKNYCYQVNAGATGFFDDKEFSTFMGAGALGIEADDFNGDNFDHKNENFLHGAGMRITQSGARPIGSNPLPKNTPSWGKEFKVANLKYANRALSVGAQGASLPFRTNYLDVDPTYKDAYGMPLVRMTFDWTEQDKALMKFQGAKAGEIMKGMGATTVTVNDTLTNYNVVPYGSTHNTGGTIMGADPATSVVNNYLQMWDAENVFIVGASNFAHNSGYNPTATVGALSYRAAEGIAKYLKQPVKLV